MFWLFHDDKPWFEPKRYGLGTGLPVAWQGWVLLAMHVALVTGIALMIGERPQAMAAAMVAAVVLPLPIYIAKTRGGWRWRWGGEK
jgi:hypothetical protein